MKSPMVLMIGFSLWYFLLIALFIVGVFFLYQYYKMKKAKEQVLFSWQKLDQQLTRRYQVIPTLLPAFESVAKRHPELFNQLGQCQNQAVNADSMLHKAKAENNLERALRDLFAATEQYPEIKSAESFREAQEELNSVEDTIRLVTRQYNIAVQANNELVTGGSNTLVARLLKFGPFDYFDLRDDQKNPPKLSAKLSDNS